MKHYIIGFLLALSLIGNGIFYLVYQDDGKIIQEYKQALLNEQAVNFAYADWSTALKKMCFTQINYDTKLEKTGKYPSDEEAKVLNLQIDEEGSLSAKLTQKLNERATFMKNVEYIKLQK